MGGLRLATRGAGWLLASLAVVLLLTPPVHPEPNTCPYCYCGFGGRGAYDDDLSRLHYVKGDKFNDTTCSDWCRERYPYVLVTEYYSRCEWNPKLKVCRSTCPGCQASSYDQCKGYSEADCERGQAGEKPCNCSFSGGGEACDTCSKCACQYTMGAYPDYVFATPDRKTEATPELCKKACYNAGEGKGRAKGQWAACHLHSGRCTADQCYGKGCTFVSSDCNNSSNPIICNAAGSLRVTCNCPLQSTSVAPECPKNTDPPVYPNGPEVLNQVLNQDEGDLYT